MIVIDDFAPIGLIKAARATWLPETSGLWHKYENGKLATKGPDSLPAACGLLIERMASLPIDSLLNVPGAFPDVEFLHGAGLHQMPPKVSLGLHLDSERHPTLPWRRVASAVLYLDTCEGGELEFCEPGGKLIKSVGSKENRLVAFATSRQWHRVNECQSIRRSLCMFFWGELTGEESSDRAVFQSTA